MERDRPRRFQLGAQLAQPLRRQLRHRPARRQRHGARHGDHLHAPAQRLAQRALRQRCVHQRPAAGHPDVGVGRHQRGALLRGWRVRGEPGCRTGQSSPSHQPARQPASEPDAQCRRADEPWLHHGAHVSAVRVGWRRGRLGHALLVSLVPVRRGGGELPDSGQSAAGLPLGAAQRLLRGIRRLPGRRPLHGQLPVHQPPGQVAQPPAHRGARPAGREQRGPDAAQRPHRRHVCGVCRVGAADCRRHLGQHARRDAHVVRLRRQCRVPAVVGAQERHLGGRADLPAPDALPFHQRLDLPRRGAHLHLVGGHPQRGRR